MILRFARSLPYEPGTNVTGGEVPGWLFLLPRLDVGRAAVVGAPRPALREALESFGNVVHDARTPAEAVESGARLVYLTRSALVAGLHSDEALAALARHVQAGGAVYLEPSPRTSELTRRLGEAATISALVLVDGTAGLPDPVPGAVLDGAVWSIPAGPARAAGRGRRAVRRVLPSARFAPPAAGAGTQHVASTEQLTARGAAGRAMLVRGDRHRPAALPSYVAEAARTQGHALDGEHWLLRPARGYRSQKIVFELPAASAVVKITQDPRFNARLDNEFEALAALDGRAAEGLAPRPLFRALHAGLVLVGESRLDGAPFRSRSTGKPDCTAAAAVIDALVELAGLGRGSPSGEEAGAALDELLSHHVRLHDPDRRQRELLRDRFAAITAAGASFPAVFSHGDATTLNVLVRDDGGIGLVDWENAEPAGMPLWDVFHFANAYAQWDAERRRRRWTAATIRATLYEPSGLHDFLREAIHRYARATALPAELVEPLTYAYWLALALREATRRSRARRGKGPYAGLLEDLVRRPRLLAGLTGAF